MSSSNTVPLPFWMQFVAGGIAGTSEICVMYPLDVVKTRFQLQVTTPSRLSGPVGGGYTSILDCFKKIIQQEGPTKLYRGILAPIMIEAPKRAVKFASNEQYTRLYKGILPNVSSQKLSIATGVSAGLTEALIVVSFELIKIRMQDKQNASLYKNTLDCVKKIYQLEGGLFAFTRGLEATLWRHASWNGAYFGVIHGVREALPKAETSSGNHLRNFVAGTIGGTIATLLNTPFDVVKTRVQGHIPLVSQQAILGKNLTGNIITTSTSAPTYGWTLPALKTIVRAEGITALYKGFLPKVLRLGPGGGILLLVFDQVTSLMRKLYLNKDAD